MHIAINQLRLVVSEPFGLEKLDLGWHSSAAAQLPSGLVVEGPSGGQSATVAVFPNNNYGPHYYLALPLRLISSHRSLHNLHLAARSR